jgi:hypothetical protein
MLVVAIDNEYNGLYTAPGILLLVATNEKGVSDGTAKVNGHALA